MRSVPSFFYLPHPMVHVPLYAGDDFPWQKWCKGIFADVMTGDRLVGWCKSSDAIEEIGAEENTLVDLYQR